MTNNKKQENFERLAENRVNEVVKKIRLIGNLANRRNYEFNEQHVEQIFSAVEDEIKQAKSKFRNELEGDSRNFKFK